MLILGGTAMLGRAVATDAITRGHAVTCLARGSASVAPGARFVAGDRDDPAGLAPVAGEGWDAVIDVSRQPGQVRRAVGALTAGHWVFVSSANVYADASELDRDESAATLPALTGDVMESMESYGNAKVACEEAVRAGPTPATIARVGLIGGPEDWSGRSGYWPWRFAHPSGPDVIVPDDPACPCAMIDVRDLAGWLVSAAERRLDGTFNVTGPTTDLAEVLRTAALVAGGATPARPVAPDRLAALGVAAWMGPLSLPLWIDDPAMRGFATLDTARARAAGLACRPLRDTLAAALAHEETRTDERAAGLSDAEEQAVRRAIDADPPRGE
ncbi:NAD-dependent epimerase/dehydratase family protein [Naumannella huperziae]